MTCPERYLSLWVAGLPDEVRAEHLRVTAGEAEMSVLYLSGKDPANLRQINVQAPASLTAGLTAVRVSCGGVTSPPAAIENRLPPNP
jgi:uncharacterized protein (TIGR03437 family)